MVDDSASTSGEDLTLQPVSVGVRTRRRALWGVLAAIVVVTGAVVVSSSGDGGPPRLPVALGSSGGREAAAPGSTTADMMLARVIYIAGDGLPALGGEAAAYRLTGAVDAGRVRALAASLGLKGEPTHDGRLWHLQSGDAVLEVYEESGGGWWYSPQAGVVSSGGSSSGGSAGCDPAATECAVTGSGSVGPATTIPGNVCTDYCTSEPAPSECPQNAQCAAPDCAPNADCAVPAPPEPVPPADLPSKAEARKIALDLLTSTGMDLTDAKVTVEGPYDAWYITVEPRLDGVPVSGWVSSVAVGSKGVIMSASGTLGTPERLGSYPLIDTRSAIDRLNTLQGQYGGGGPVPMGAPYSAVARDSGVATAIAPMPTTPCAPDDPSCAPLVDPVGPTTTGVSQCKVQADGTEICETTGVGTVQPGGGPVECLAPAVGPGTDPAIAVPTTQCGPVGICYDILRPMPLPTDGTETTLAPSPECQPPVQPEPVKVTLTKAEPVLSTLPASDGSGDVYLVPGYRFSNADGVTVDVAAVADDSLAPTTTVPVTTNSSAVTPPPPTSCQTVVEGDGSATTHTIQTCPQPTEPSRLEPGQTPEIGVAYYVDINTHCGMLVFGDRWWATDSATPLAWSTPTEGGTFTLSSPDAGTFVGDAEGTKTAEFTARGPATDIPGCA